MSIDCPLSLRDHWISLQPFMDVIGGHDFNTNDGEEPDYILLDFSIWKDGKCIIPRFFKITKAGVVYEDADGMFLSSMQELWEYMRSLPRPPYSFVKGWDVNPNLFD